ncbi:MAG: DUF1080 domain-containing protein, partial [Planctomycetes bacterium]|nr:DUF1080 domain-containing protein [Planctomycetota bacterium]
MVRCDCRRLSALLLLLFILIVPANGQGVVINEIMASNGGTLADEDDDFEDWVELYNAGLQAVNLRGWGLTDDPDNPYRWVFPEVIIEPGEFLLVWASGKDRKPDQNVYLNGILREVYLNIPGGTVEDLTNHPDFPDSPTSRNRVTDYFEAPTNIADNYGQRMHGYILPPQSGYYIFWLSGDNGSRLYLSTDSNPANMTAIAEIPGAGWSNYPRHWDRYPDAQQSDPIYLEAGRYYYICALMKEDVGGDHLAVRWQLPNGIIEEPIPAARLFVRPEQLHTNFSLSADGEPVCLTAADGTIVDSIEPVKLGRDISFGRVSDGGSEWGYFSESTPAASNASAHAYAGIVPQPVFSHSSGFYADPFQLTLSVDDPDAVIYYSRDGSVPDPTALNGTPYGYKNQYPNGDMLYRECRSYVYTDGVAIDADFASPGGLAGINTENSSGPSTPVNNWSIEGDELVQRSLASNVRLMFGDTGWTDYELTLEAKKTGGYEGFLVFFRANGNHYYFVNYGGWGNTLHGIEKGNGDGTWSIFVDRVSGSVNTDQWYTIRVRCEGLRIRCWLDDNLIFNFSDRPGSPNLAGQAGVGTWQTQARYRNITVKSLDGNVLYSGLPTPGQDMQPVPVNVIRARACKNGYIPSETADSTYFLQSQALPHTVPVINLTFQEPDFFGYEKGIYVAGQNRDQIGVPNYELRGFSWERPASFTLFGTDGTVLLEQNIGVRIHGGWTRNLPQKSLRLYARAGYGESEFDYPIFSDHAADRFKRLVLRNSGNDNAQTFFRDAMMQALVSHLPIDTQAYQPAAVYFNGQYWGLHNIRERYDKYYLHYKYGLDPDDVDILEILANVRGHQVKQGDAFHYDQTLNYIEANGLSDPVHYAYIQTRIDTDNFIDNNVCNIYFNNTDWPGNNNDWWRKHTDAYEPGAPYGHDGRWRWMLFDTDFGFGQAGGYADNTLAYATAVSDAWNNPQWATYLLRKLLENDTFKKDFINRYADLLNTAFLPARVVAVIDRCQQAIAAEMPAHIARWGRPGSIGDWNYHVNVTRDFANRRPDYARSHLRSYFGLGQDRQLTLDVADRTHGFIRVNRTDINAQTPGVNPQEPYPWSGLYFEDVPITVTAVPAPGYRFSHWQGPVAAEDMDLPTLTVQLAEDMALTAHFEPLTLLHFWCFTDELANNTPFESVASSYSIPAPAVIEYHSALMAYPFNPDHPYWRKASLERYNAPTGLNYRPEGNRNRDYSQAAVKGLQVRQPFAGDGGENTLIFHLPTTGYRDVVFCFAAMDEGAAESLILEYSVSSDSAQWLPYSQDTAVFALWQNTYRLYEVDFSSIPQADDNPDFKVRIRFETDDAQRDEGNRVAFNNISLDGVPLPGTNQPPQMVEPLPFTEAIEQMPVTLDVSAYFSDPESDPLTFTAQADKPFVAQASVVGSTLTLVPLYRGDTTLTVTASDGHNPPASARFRLLVYPAARTLRLGAFEFDSWSPDQPEHTFPDGLLFLQSNTSDPGLDTPLEYAYFIPHDGEDSYHANDIPDTVGYPYRTTGRSRINGLGEEGISFINTGRQRDLGGALTAVDTTGLDSAAVRWLGGTLEPNVRRYAIRLQYRIGWTGAFLDVLSGGQPVEYLVQDKGHTEILGPIALPAEALEQPYVQLLWRYYHVDGDSGARAQLRLDD